MSKSIADIYLTQVMKTNNSDYEAIAKRLSDPKTILLLHAAMGLVTEAAEFMDVLKKHAIYGKEIDEVNLLEELGDSNWYQGLALNGLLSSFEIVMIANIRKLRARYPDKFSASSATERNLDNERSVLEKEFDLATGFGIGDRKLVDYIKERFDVEEE